MVERRATSSKARYSRTDDTGGRRRRRRDDATGELKRAIAGREHEFSGLLLIVGGVILAAGVFFKVAGILGDGVDTLVGSLAGLARYVVPFVLIAMGIAFIRRSRTSSPWRLLFGWTFVALAMLGILHVARGPQGFSVNGVTKAGGVLGWAVGEPLRTLVEDFGAYVLFGAVGLVRGDAHHPGVIAHDGPAHRARRPAHWPRGRRGGRAARAGGPAGTA